MPPLRKILLAVALVATIGASVFDLPWLEDVQPQQAGAAPAPHAIPAQSPAPAVQEAPLLRKHFESQAVDLFSVRSWQPAPAPPLKPEAPKAPPLPFRYLGKVLEGEEVLAFVSQDARTHVLRKGDVVAAYRVEQITPAEMTLVYLPLNEKQRLLFGSTN